MKNLFLFTVVLMLGVLGCKQEHALTSELIANPSTQDETDKNLIINYIIDSLSTTKFEKTASGIYYFIEKEGEGVSPDVSEMVTAHLSEALLDGTTISSTYERGEPFTFQIARAPKAWQEAMGLLKTGGKGKFLIPSSLAYGAQGGQGLPPNSVLIFNTELIDIFDSKKQVGVDDEIIAKHIADKGLKMQKTEDGIYYNIEKAGKGANPTLASTVEVHYRGTHLDGTEFDSSYKRGESIEFPLTGVVVGWQKAIPLLKPGGKGTFIIPSGLAYGPGGRPGIPANSNLVFDVELVSIK